MAKKSKNDELKTLMNCSNIEFLTQANLIKADVEKFLKETKINEIRRKKLELTGKETDEEKKALDKKRVENIWDEIFKATFVERPEMTMDILAKMCFTTPDVIGELSPTEITNLAILLLGDRRINDFFTALSAWGLLDTEKS